ncbi:hypothetical protein LTS17_002890 [Exophiala oligosperma]
MDSSSPNKSQLPYRPRDYISIFIHTLHLLDLDLLPDFPPTLTESSLRHSSPKAAPPTNLQQRVKSVEWALYRLFETYDPVETREKLQPHFPPSTPRDSLNLRAALYKSLTELKKNGSLPKETVLRKTMLDECKGDKFEELLASFGMLVLRKKVDDDHRDGKKSKNPNPNQNLKLRDVNKNTEQIIPILLAHRTSLQNTLQQRRSLKENAATQTDEIRRLREDIGRRIQSLTQDTLPEDEFRNEDDDEDEGLKDRLNHAFAMDRRWATFLLEGTTAPRLALSDTDTSPQEDPDDKRNDTFVNDADTSNEPMTQLLESLEDRRSHTERLKRLRDNVHRSPPVETTRHSIPSGKFSAAAVLADAGHDDEASVNHDNTQKTVRFGRHQALYLGALST